MHGRRVFMCAVVGMLLAIPSMAAGSDSIARAKAKVNKGDSHLVRGQFADAERLFLRAAEIEPALPSAYLGLGAAFIGQRRYLEALDALDEAERRYAEFDEQRRASGEMAVEGIESTARQVEHLEQTWGAHHQIPARGLDPNVVGLLNIDSRGSMPSHAYYLQGVAYLRTGQKAEGIERLERCLAGDGDHGLAHHNLTVAFFSLGQLDEARRHLDAAKAAGIEPPPELVAQIEAGIGARAVAVAGPPPQ